ncbi:amino acid/polyamine/organocation transporter, APC superfamily [Celeribacter baekdonensis]|uniref:Amino acid/polyamine/organocation transporter, APC superfamily n=1 Tax=Celeribacter baekdonensis TaxID=875171 RepID=A0A1G7ILA9_9RHOB|nr:APC family permease [Celeribacter baekdonensis]SDF13316.1 amino acid/polyamine/organocation transporter, APC superfamily [Celeribacter baekdonensis]
MAEILKRRIGPGLLTAYGVGVMVGAGIYVLVGAVAAEAGLYAPLAFLLAGLVAAPSALSYAELSTRIPEAAGEAAYVEAGFGARWLGRIVGLAIVAGGAVSAAAVLRGGAGYLTSFFDVPQIWAIIGLGVFLVVVAVVGVLESLAMVAVFTLVEVAGLALVVWAGWHAPVSPDWSMPAAPYVPGIGVAATLAFFAFIGFEDIVNMAEEVKRPERSLPIAIIASLIITTLLYAGVTVIAVRAVPIEDLAASERPLALVFEAGGGPIALLSLIAVIAALNGVLAQIVMAARVMFGLGKSGGVLSVFRHAHPRFGTPVLATVLIGGFVICAALALPVSNLAGVTSTILLLVFTLVNASLILLKRHTPKAPFRPAPKAPFCIAPWVPWVGLIFALLALAAFALGGAV